MSENTLPEALAGKPDRRVIRGKALRAVAMPLGGIGAGQIAMAGDGGWRQWQIMNVPNHLGHVPHSFFAVRMRPHAVHFTERRSPEDVMGVSRVLMSSALYDSRDFIPPVTSSDHTCRKNHGLFSGNCRVLTRFVTSASTPLQR